jgi:hypothetical protein
VPGILELVGSKEYYVLSMSHVANRQIKSLLVVKILSHVPRNELLLMEAVWSGEISEVKSLIESGANILHK